MRKNFENFVDSVKTLEITELKKNEINVRMKRLFSRKEASYMKVSKHVKLLVFALGYCTFDYNPNFVSVQDDSKKLAVLLLLLVFQCIQPPVSSLKQLAYQAVKQRGCPKFVRVFNLTIDDPISNISELVVPLGKLICMDQIKDLSCFECLFAFRTKVTISKMSYTHKVKHCLLINTQNVNKRFVKQLERAYKIMSKEYKHLEAAAFPLPNIGIKFKSYRGDCWDFDYEENRQLLKELRCLQHINIFARYSDRHNFVQWHENYGQLDASLCFLFHVFKNKRIN